MQSDRHEQSVAEILVASVGGLSGGRRSAAGNRSHPVADPKLIGDVEYRKPIRPGPTHPGHLASAMGVSGMLAARFRWTSKSRRVSIWANRNAFAAGSTLLNFFR